MIRIALCDDEQKILDEVTQYIKKYAEPKFYDGKAYLSFAVPILMPDSFMVKNSNPYEYTPYDKIYKISEAISSALYFI